MDYYEYKRLKKLHHNINILRDLSTRTITQGTGTSPEGIYLLIKVSS